MQVEQTKSLRDGLRLEVGIATWDKGEGELSVRARFTNRAGGFSTGSPEVPVQLLEPMLEFARECGADV